MRRIFVATVGTLVFGFPGSTRANDLAEALTFAESIMGEEITVGYENLMDWDETEALPILLSRDVVPNAPPEYYTDRGGSLGFAPRTSFFQTLGSSRLDFYTLRPFIMEASSETGLPVELIDAVIRTESGYRAGAVSRAGAQGLMQLMPTTQQEVGVTDPFDPRQNILGGARYLRKMYDRFGSVELAVAAYNAGPNAVAKADGIPPFKETKAYVATVLKRYEKGVVSTNPLQ